jgi:hypothetical protein
MKVDFEDVALVRPLEAKRSVAGVGFAVPFLPGSTRTSVMWGIRIRTFFELPAQRDN